MHPDRKYAWMFGWTPPWHRKDGELNQHSSTGGRQHRQRSARRQNHSSKVATFENDPIYISNNYSNSESFSSRQPDPILDTASQLSSSTSSFASSFRRNTKGSVLDFFHRRKSSTPSSVISSHIPSQQSSITGSYPPGRTSTLPASNSISVLANGAAQPYATIHSTSPASTLSTPPCAVNNAHHQVITAITSPPTQTTTATSAPSSIIHQHHRFPFVNHHNETVNAPSTIPEEQCFPPSSHHKHRVASLSSQNGGSHLSPYETLLQKSSPFNEYTMEGNTPPIMDDTKRITLRHDLVKLALDGLFKSPLDPHQEGERQVLQIGCGNGAWCIDCAKEHPQWFVFGLDDPNGGPLISAASGKKMMMSGTSSLSSASSNPIILPNNTATSSTSISSSFPGLTAKGRNFTFVRSTTTLVESLKMFPDGQFDLIYGRFLALALPPSEYEDLISQCWRVCKPGGFVEFTELDMRIYGTHGSGTLVKKLNQQMVSAMKKKNLDPRLPRHLQDLFFKLLVDDQPASSRQRQNSYQVKYNSLPLGVWGGRLGVMFRDDIHDVLEALNVTTNTDNDTANTAQDDVEEEEDIVDDLDDENVTDDKEYRKRNVPFEEDWTATTDILDDELDSQMAFMNIYQIFAQKHKD